MTSEWLSKLWMTVFYLLLPIRLLLFVILYVLGWLFAPLLLLGRFGVHISDSFFRFLAHFETFYFYFGVAAVVGLVFGLALHLVLRFSASVFGLDRPLSPTDRPAQGHSAASYRSAREKRRLNEDPSKTSQLPPHPTEPPRELAEKGPYGRQSRIVSLGPNSPRQRTGLLSTTILEEADNSEEDYWD